MLKLLVVDDEPLAHQVLQHHLQDSTDIALVGSCYNATEALRFLAQQPVDLLLLDINMPALSGIELLKVLHNRPPVILISAYKEFAIEGFELDVVDYLVKPVSRSRLLEAINKVYRRLGTASLQAEPYIVLKVDREKRRFLVNDIDLLEAYGNYVKVWQGEQVTLVNSTLKRLLQLLPALQFIQVHKSFVVNKSKIVALEQEQLRLEGGQPVKVGKAYKSGLSGVI